MLDYPKDWREVDLTNIANTFIGLVTTMTSNYTNDGAKLIRNQDIQNNKFIFKENIYLNREFAELKKSRMHKLGDVVTVHTGDIGTSAVIEESLVGSLGFATIVTRLDKKIADPYFISCYFNSKHYKDYVMSIMTGDGRNNLNMRDFNKTRLMLPSLPEQKAIAKTLMTFDRHIENLERLIEKKKMVRDGAIEDLMTGNTRLDRFDDEWEEVEFNDVIVPKARIGWQGLKKDEYLQSGYSYLISGTDFNQGTISFSKISYVTKERYDLDINIQVNSGDVLVTKDGTIGKVAIVPSIDKKATLNSGVFVFKTNKTLARNFLYWILRSSIFGKFIDDLSAGSTIKHLYQKDLKKFSFYIPKDINEQKAISSILKSLDDDLQNLKKEKEKIEKIKAGAMDDLLTGRVRLI